MTPASARRAYRLLTSYRFARRYVEGRSVADFAWSDLGYGSRLLAGTAASVDGLADSPAEVLSARELHSAPNVHYGTVDFTDLPYPDAHFDAAVAFGVLENLRRPEEFVREAERVLAEDGVFIVSTPDRRFTNHRKGSSDGREMYVPDLRDLLGLHFKNVELFRQGTVAGGLIYKDREQEAPDGVPVESTGFFLTDPTFGKELPRVGLVVAVCDNRESPGSGDGGPLLLLDADARLLDEHEDSLEDVELLRDEIRVMEETEVRAFRDTLDVRHAEIAGYKERLKRYEALENQKRNLENRVRALENQRRPLENRARELETHVRNIESSTTWKLLTVYRRLRGAR